MILKKDIVIKEHLESIRIVGGLVFMSDDYDDGISAFIEYLDKLIEMSTLFKGLQLSTEVIDDMDLGLTDTQYLYADEYLEKMQNEWSEAMLLLLKYGVKWIENNMSEENE